MIKCPGPQSWFQKAKTMPPTRQFWHHRATSGSCASLQFSGKVAQRKHDLSKLVQFSGTGQLCKQVIAFQTREWFSKIFWCDKECFINWYSNYIFQSPIVLYEHEWSYQGSISWNKDIVWYFSGNMTWSLITKYQLKIQKNHFNLYLRVLIQFIG